MDSGRQKRINSTTIWLLKNSFNDIKQLYSEIETIKIELINPYIYLSFSERIELLIQIKLNRDEIKNLNNFIKTLRGDYLTIC